MTAGNQTQPTIPMVSCAIQNETQSLVSNTHWPDANGIVVMVQIETGRKREEVPPAGGKVSACCQSMLATIKATTHQLYNCLLLTFTDLHTYMHIEQFCCCQTGLSLWITSCQLYHYNSVLLHQCIGAIDVSLILSKHLLIYSKRVSIYCCMLATLEHNTSKGRLRLSTVLGVSYKFY